MLLETRAVGSSDPAVRVIFFTRCSPWLSVCGQPALAGCGLSEIAGVQLLMGVHWSSRVQNHLFSLSGESGRTE